MEVRLQVLSECRAGHPYSTISARHGVPRSTIGYWLHVDRTRRGEKAPEGPKNCPRCHGAPLDRCAYSYLLGLYLGDGHIVSRGKQHHLSIYCGDDWPGLIDQAQQTMQAVLPGHSTGRRQKQGCTEVKSYSRHWTCLFPQHGPGMKHTRMIALEPWQGDIADEHPWALLRGLIHSDGCRITNWTVRTVGGENKRYEYPRYFFTNTSADITGIFTGVLDRVGVEWRLTTRRSTGAFDVSVARRASVTLMDRHIGPKY